MTNGGDTLPSVNVLGVRVDAFRVPELHAMICRIIASQDRALVLCANAHALNLAYERPWLREFFNRADAVFCDGTGVMLAARMLGARIPQRITYADWMWQLAALAAEEGFSIFLLGGRDGVAQQAADRLRERYPALRVVGVHHGYFDKDPAGAENARIVQMITAARPNILLVAFGMPRQELWLMENWERLPVNVGLTGGAVLDYVSGNLRRSPGWLRNRGFEWLGRLAIEPIRLGKRYLIGNPLFLFRVLAQRGKPPAADDPASGG